MTDAGDIRRMRAIIDRLKAFDVVPREMPGHEERGGTWARVPVGIIEHHDAASIKSGEWGALGLILDGTPRGIPGPLSQFQVARCLDGIPKVAIVADGRASHAGTGIWRFPDGLQIPRDSGNAWLYGTEVANNGLGEPYTAACDYAIDALCRAVLEVCS